MKNQVTLEDGKEYWLGSLSATYNIESDSFIGGNFFIARCETIYAEAQIAPKQPEITAEYIKAKVSSDPRWAQRAIIALYHCQTEDEKSAQTTAHLNGIGFNGSDAFILSSFAQQINRGRLLSEKQLAIAFKKLPKYAGQLYRIASSK